MTQDVPTERSADDKRHQRSSGLVAEKEACLAIFNSNTPPFFAPHEREEFAQFLDTLSGPYFVVEHNGQVIGCGGFFLIPNTPAVVLTWGMVAGRGMARALAAAS